MGEEAVTSRVMLQPFFTSTIFVPEENGRKSHRHPNYFIPIPVFSDSFEFLAMAGVSPYRAPKKTKQKQLATRRQ